MFHYFTKPRVIPNFLTDEEIDYIKQNTTGKFSKSLIYRDLFSSSTNFNTRISETAWIHHKNHILKQISDKCATILDKKQINHEDLQVVYYKTGGFFKPHQDCIDEKCTRMYAFIMALNDDYEGGETEFPNLDMKYKLNKGDALFFHLKDNHGLETSSALHGGLPVKSGEKLICNLWVHRGDGHRSGTVCWMV